MECVLFAESLHFLERLTVRGKYLFDELTGGKKKIKMTKHRARAL